ncbi:MAG: hypothetical protein Q4E39_01890 [bacterium]|nr:hypothetical protein [bacterium]
MKAATGELNLTVITLIAIAAVLGFFWWMWPNIQNSIEGQWNDINGQVRNGSTTKPNTSSGTGE